MIGLVGDTDMDYLKEYLGYVDYLDGYRVTYSFDLTYSLSSSELHMIIFGFDQDPLGYFGIGVIADQEEDDKYSTHGAGYWAWKEDLTYEEV